MTHSNEFDQKKAQDRALGALAVGIAEKKTEKLLSVSDDVLLAFYQNQLDDELRVQVLHAIANDNDTHHRWIGMVQALELEDELSREDLNLEQGTSSDKPIVGVSEKNVEYAGIRKWDIVGALSAWFKQKGSWTGTLGGRHGMAVLAVLAIFLTPQLFRDSSLGVDELYDQFGANYIAAMAASDSLPKKAIVISKNSEAKPYSTVEAELAKGIEVGFKEFEKLNLPSEWRIDPDRYATFSFKPDRNKDSPYAFGRLVALSLVHCRYAEHNDYFEAVASLMRELSEQYDSIGSQVAIAGSDRDDVCNRASTIIERL